MNKMANLALCLSRELAAPRLVMQNPTWERFGELVEKISSIPTFDTAFFQTLAQLEDGPSRLQMMRMYIQGAAST